MNVLVVSSRFPWPAYSGDRVRVATWIEALAPHARVALVAPDGKAPRGVRFFPAKRSLARGVRGALTVLRNGLPVQTLLAAPFAWDEAVDAARRELGPFDVNVVVLSREDPWVRASLAEGLRILDSIDSLRRNAEERANAATAVTRWFWRREERHLARVECQMPSAYDHVVICSEEETRELGGGAIVIPNSVRVDALDTAVPRRYDFGFWGRLAYFANADAARCLLEEIVPAIRERVPSATFILGGADAARPLRLAAEGAGVDFVSPIDDIATFARNVRVAILPVRHGSGQSSKLLEAAEAGCAIVTTAQVARGAPRVATHAAIASDASSIATTAVALLHDEARRNVMIAALRRAVEQHHSREHVLEAMAELAGVRRTGAVVNG